MTPRLLRRRSRRIRAFAAALVLAILPASAASAQLPEPADPLVTERPDDWPQPAELEVEAAVLVEASSGQVLLEQQPDQRRPVASTIKVLTALSVLERTDLDDEVTAGDEVLDVPGSGVDLQPGDTWTVEELVDALISRSGNEAAEALAVHVAGDVDGFTDLMEQDAASIGVEGLELSSPSGLDDAQQLSAQDLATIARAALDDDRLRPFLGRTSVTLPGVGSVPTRNELLDRYDGATGVKTGFTSAAGNSLVASAERDGREVVAVVLGAGDDPARFDIAGELLDLGLDDFSTHQLSGQLRLAVGGGNVQLEVDPVEVSAPTGRDIGLDWPLTPRPPDEAPTVAITDGAAEGAAPLGSVPARLDRDVAELDPDGAGGDALGRAVVDGVYAGLRAAAVTERLS